jgi:hypothetical protein
MTEYWNNGSKEWEINLIFLTHYSIVPLFQFPLLSLFNLHENLSMTEPRGQSPCLHAGVRFGTPAWSPATGMEDPGASYLLTPYLIF